ncbi:hypothetical protein HYZ80_00640 [Candidatus Parcubacteria bacterium]|nr:hypothetical protein [Candidatus Parcubacteria bacterium]
MDTFGHALWTGALYRKNPKRWVAVVCGVVPDLPILAALLLNPWPLLKGQGLPALDTIPPFLVALDLTAHSVLVFAVMAAVVWLMRPDMLVPFSGWGLHILIDVFSHANVPPFTATTFLFPVSDASISVVNWNHPVFIGVNYTLLALVYVLLWQRRIRTSPKT